MQTVHSWDQTCKKQAVPVLFQWLLVATGMEEVIARDSGRLILAEEAGRSYLC